MASIKKLLKDAPRMRNSMPRKAQSGDSIPSIKGAITPVPNGPLVKKKGPYAGSTLKSGGKVKVMAGGEKHVVYKSKKNSSKATKGDIIVNHPTKDKGKWDTINLTKIGRAKTVKQGVVSTKKWHKDNPNYKYKGKKK
jgi:hypothetical protein